MAEKRIARARNIDAFMTAVFYAIAIFFFTLLAAFAGKVIIGGLMGATPEMFPVTYTHLTLPTILRE